MKLKNLLKLYKISKNWDFINDKLSIPDFDLDKLEILHEGMILENEYNPNNSTVKGEYMPEMNEEEYTKWQQQKSGWAKFYDKVKYATKD